MPSTKNYKRDYKTERSTSLARGENPGNIERKRARRDMESEGRVSVGDNKDVNHKIALSKGGSNSRKNLEVTATSKNRSFPRKPDGSIK